MAAAKCASLAATGVRGASVVNLITRNGTDMALQIAGLAMQIYRCNGTIAQIWWTP